MVQYNPSNYPVSRLQFRNSDEYSLKFLCSFFKSSFFLWLLISKYEEMDFYKSDIFSRMSVPKLDLQKPSVRTTVKAVEEIFDTIMKKENEFLKLKCSSLEEFNDAANKHNRLVDLSVVKIDDYIYELLALSENYIEIINETLKAMQVYVPVNAFIQN